MNSFAVIGEGSGEITEKKSRFIATVREVHSEDEAQAFIDSMRRKYWDARHNCYAFVTGMKNEIQRFSDDREPSGTAGRPILDVLLGSGVRNTLIVVTRYFGGILLGTGGLVRAYTEAANAGLAAMRKAAASSGGKCGLFPLLEGRMIRFSLDYKDISRFDSLCLRLNMCALSRDYLEKAVYTMFIEDRNMDSFLKEAADITGGAFALEESASVFCIRSGNEAFLYRS